jgi:hypothetical protein
MVSNNANSHEQACPLAFRTNWHSIDVDCGLSCRRSRFALLLTALDLAIPQDKLIRLLAGSSPPISTLLYPMRAVQQPLGARSFTPGPDRNSRSDSRKRTFTMLDYWTSTSRDPTRGSCVDLRGLPHTSARRCVSGDTARLDPGPPAGGFGQRFFVLIRRCLCRVNDDAGRKFKVASNTHGPAGFDGESFWCCLYSTLCRHPLVMTRLGRTE